MAESTGTRLLENQYIAVKRCRHGIFAYNTNDLYISRSMDMYGEWCESEVALLLQVLKPGDVVLDVGANIGTHTVALATQVTATGSVYAVEPQRLTFQLLCANVALNALTNVVCLNAAVGETEGTTRIPTLDPLVENNFGGLPAQGHDSGEEVKVIRLDDLSLPRCNLIKIDVEGMETGVLAGARRTIREFRPVLFVENNSQERSAAVLKSLDELGYSCWWHVASYFNPDNFFHHPHKLFGEYWEANVICFPKEARVNAVGLWPVQGLDDTYIKAMQRHGAR
jgi:FkbM family methyltransferase